MKATIEQNRQQKNSLDKLEQRMFGEKPYARNQDAWVANFQYRQRLLPGKPAFPKSGSSICAATADRYVSRSRAVGIELGTDRANVQD